MADSTLTPDTTPDEGAWTGDMTVVAKLPTAQEALTLKGCLQAAGIPASLGDAHTVQTNMLWATALGGVRVMVPQAFAARATEVIAEYRSGAFEIEGDVDPALPPPTTATDLALWGPDLSAILSLWLTPLFGSVLHWLNSRKLGRPELARRADLGLALAVVATAAAFWLMRERDWTAASPFVVSGFMSVYTALWYLLVAHSQSRFIARSFGRQYRHRNVWLAAAAAFAAMLAVGFGVEAVLAG